MSVLMTLWVQGDPKKVEEKAGENPDGMKAIVEKAARNGLIAHRFYGNDEGQIMVIDEWPDEESFKRFFEEAQGDIGPLMQAAGVQQEPRTTFWRKLETHDEYGWGA